MIRISSYLKNLITIFLLVPAVLILVVLFLNPNIISRKTSGSFEYVRKGETMYDKGRFLDAIKYYEKAHEASPGNDLIRAYLIYAYSRYATNLADSDKYDEAVGYLLKAYDLEQNQYTIQNAAIMYGKRSLSHMKHADWVKAQDDLETACELVDPSNNASRNFGISLFNDAVGEFKAGRDDSAILLLKAAVLVYGDSRIYEFLGDIYYRKNDLERAQFYFDKAVKLDPQNSKISEKREKAARSHALAGTEETTSLPYFDIKYEKGLIANTELVAEALRKAYVDVGKDLGYFPDRKTAVFFYSERDFRDIFRMPSIVRAFYDGNIRIPYPEIEKGENELISYLYHEYTHAVLSAKTNNNCPVWLAEGIAVFEELKWTRSGTVVTLAGKIDGNYNMSLKALDNEFKTEYKNDPSVAVAYLIAFTAVDYIVDHWGLKGLRSLLKRISGGQHAVNAIDDEFLLSEKEFQKKWNEYVAKKYLKPEEGK